MPRRPQMAPRPSMPLTLTTASVASPGKRINNVEVHQRNAGRAIVSERLDSVPLVLEFLAVGEIDDSAPELRW